MGLRVKTNINSLIAQRQLAINNEEMQDSIKKLSSGYRINKSSDDAAGLEISETMRAKIRGLSQAKRNASDGVSFLQIGEGGLNELSNLLIRMKELTTQSASDTINKMERSYLNQEFQELSKEIVRIKDQTEFNGKYMLSDTSKKNLKIQIGIGTNNPDKDKENDYNTIDLKYTGVMELDKSISNLSKLNISGDSGSEIGGDGPEEIFSALDDSMSKIASMRANFGSLQTRLNSAITSIDIANENLSAAQSRIRDVDYASETSRFAQSKILVSAGTSVLSQANQMPEHVLSLLRQ